MIILIGSQAAKINGLDLKRKTDENEYDMIGELSDVQLFRDKGYEVQESKNFPGKFKMKKGQTVIEFDATDNDSNETLMIMTHHEALFTINNALDFVVFVPSNEILFLIKRSHANFSVHFEKTLHDLKTIEKRLREDNNTPGWTYREIMDDCHRPSVKTELRVFYIFRHGEAKERFGRIQDRIKLNKSNEEFFKGGANLRVYEHDDIHRAVAFFPDRPMFERCKWDLESAKIDKELFNLLHPRMKLMMVQEESMVIGIERYGLKANTSDPQRIYTYGLMKLTKDLCKGWFQDFILDHTIELETPLWDYMSRFNAALDAGKVQRVNKTKEN